MKIRWLGTVAAVTFVGCTAFEASPDPPQSSVPDSGADSAVPSVPGMAPELPDAPVAVTANAVPVTALVTTVAGSGTAAFADGNGASASFNEPDALAVDDKGVIFVADASNNRIRRIALDRSVTTFAGSGTDPFGPGGFADGPGNVAGFYAPRGVTVKAGDVFIGDYGSNAVRKITAAGFVTTIAGSPSSQGYADGPVSTAKFNGPRGVAVKADGALCFVDAINNRVRQISTGGVVSTIAGNGTKGFADGPGASASFNYPAGLAADRLGSLYVADLSNHRIRKITAAGVVSTVSGSGTRGFADGPGAAATFDTPIGVAVDGVGNLYVSDSGNNRIRRLTPAGVVSTLAGSGAADATDGPGSTATFNGPSGVALDTVGNLFVADTANGRIRKVTIAGIAEVAVTWKAPVRPGTTPITSYVASATAPGQAPRRCTAEGKTLACTIVGLTTGVAYDVSVSATNAAGSGASSVKASATPN